MLLGATGGIEELHRTATVAGDESRGHPNLAVEVVAIVVRTCGRRLVLRLLSFDGVENEWGAGRRVNHTAGQDIRRDRIGDQAALIGEVVGDALALLGRRGERTNVGSRGRGVLGNQDQVFAHQARIRGRLYLDLELVAGGHHGLGWQRRDPGRGWAHGNRSGFGNCQSYAADGPGSWCSCPSVAAARASGRSPRNAGNDRHSGRARSRSGSVLCPWHAGNDRDGGRSLSRGVCSRGGNNDAATIGGIRRAECRTAGAVSGQSRRSAGEGREWADIR